jgi:hypothetical protein
MPSSNNTLARTINYASACVGQVPLVGIGGNANEPAFSIADWVRNFILAPPFSWRWNRQVNYITTTIGQQDYTLQQANLGWLEQATILVNGQTQQLEVWLDLSEETVNNQPVRIATRLDDTEGNITFRISPPPDKAYKITITFQRSSSLFQATTDTWSPIPDYLSYLYNQGFLAKTYEYRNDARFALSMQMFVRQVIAANAGLTDSQVNIFLGDRLNTQREAQNATGTSSSAQAGRGFFNG